MKNKLISSVVTACVCCLLIGCGGPKGPTVYDINDCEKKGDVTRLISLMEEESALYKKAEQTSDEKQGHRAFIKAFNSSMLNLSNKNLFAKEYIEQNYKKINSDDVLEKDDVRLFIYKEIQTLKEKDIDSLKGYMNQYKINTYKHYFKDQPPCDLAKELVKTIDAKQSAIANLNTQYKYEVERRGYKFVERSAVENDLNKAKKNYRDFIYSELASHNVNVNNFKQLNPNIQNQILAELFYMYPKIAEKDNELLYKIDTLQKQLSTLEQRNNYYQPFRDKLRKEMIDDKIDALISKHNTKIEISRTVLVSSLEKMSTVCKN